MMTEEKKGVGFPRLEIPVVGVTIPSMRLPSFPPKPLKLSDTQLETLRFGVMDDVADIIPVVGDVAADLAHAELKKRLKPEEFEAFTEANKMLPSSLALLKVFTEKQG